MSPAPSRSADRPATHGRVLVVDDEPEMRRMICAALRSQGWETLEAATMEEVMGALEADAPTAVTLDVNLRGESGYDVCRRIREMSDVPILFLTARSDEFDHVLGLELGADDFLTKPFSHRVLAARIAAVVRRRAPARPSGPLSIGPVTLDLGARRAHVGSRPVALTKNEFDLLAILLAEPHRAFTRRELLERIWGEWHSDDHVLDTTIGRLRAKLEHVGAGQAIETLRGVGYRLEPDACP